MGAAYYPEFERKIADYDPSVQVSGKSVASAMEELDGICKDLGIPSLMSFYSESNEEAFAKIGEPAPPDLPDNPVHWSEPVDGLKTVSTLITYLNDRPDELPNAANVREDLEAFQTVLQKAQEYETRFRLRIDI